MARYTTRNLGEPGHQNDAVRKNYVDKYFLNMVGQVGREIIFT